MHSIAKVSSGIAGWDGGRFVIGSAIGFLSILNLCGPGAKAQDGPFSPIVSSDTSQQYFSQKSRSLVLAQQASAGANSSNPCDLNGDGQVDVNDVQLAANQALNITPCTTADLLMNGTCSVLDVQIVINDIETGTCAMPNCVPTTTYPNTNQYPTPVPTCPPPLPPNPNPPNTNQDDGPIHPCMYVSQGVRFQAIAVTGVSGQQTLNANLYLGTTCDANNLADVVFGGQSFPFFGSSIYWLIHFWDEPNTSLVWTVGNLTTRCIDYSKVSDCN